MAVMNYDEFNAFMLKTARHINEEEEIDCPVYIVHFRYKHTWEEKWTYTTELYMRFGAAEKYYWQNDWWEGQEEIEPYGIQSLDAVEIPCNLNPLPSF